MCNVILIRKKRKMLLTFPDIFTKEWKRHSQNSKTFISLMKLTDCECNNNDKTITIPLQPFTKGKVGKFYSKKLFCTGKNKWNFIPLWRHHRVRTALQHIRMTRMKTELGSIMRRSNPELSLQCSRFESKASSAESWRKFYFTGFFFLSLLHERNCHQWGSSAWDGSSMEKISFMCGRRGEWKIRKIRKANL